MESVLPSVDGRIMGRRIGVEKVMHFQGRIERVRAVKHGIFRGMRRNKMLRLSSKHDMALYFGKAKQFRRMAPKAAIADQSETEVTKNFTH